MLPLWLAACTDAPDDETTQKSHPPNVLVVMLDDVGVDKIGVYDEHPILPATPNLDALASGGRLFRNVWAYPTCSPARAALMTGRHPRRTGMGRAILAHDDAYELPLSEITLPEYLVPLGYDASLVGKWHLSSYIGQYRFEHPGLQGFPWYSATMENLNASRDEFDRTDGYYHWEKNLNGSIVWTNTYATTDQIDEALVRMSAMTEPWLLYLSLSAAHSPFSPPPDGFSSVSLPPNAADRALYQATVEAMDHELGRLFANVDLDDTLLLVLGDNGTTEEGVLPPWDPNAAKESMMEGGIGVPMIAAGIWVQGAVGTETAALVSVVDVLPTLFDALDLPIPDEVPLDGQSFLSALHDPDSDGRETLYAEEFSPFGEAPKVNDQRAVRDAHFKLLVGEVSGERALFDLRDRSDDGPNLLDAPLSAEAEAAHARLSDALDRYRQTVLP